MAGTFTLSPKFKKPLTEAHRLEQKKVPSTTKLRKEESEFYHEVQQLKKLTTKKSRKRKK